MTTRQPFHDFYGTVWREQQTSRCTYYKTGHRQRVLTTSWKWKWRNQKKKMPDNNNRKKIIINPTVRSCSDNWNLLSFVLTDNQMVHWKVVDFFYDPAIYQWHQILLSFFMTRSRFGGGGGNDRRIIEWVSSITRKLWLAEIFQTSIIKRNGESRRRRPDLLTFTDIVWRLSFLIGIKSRSPI